MSSISLCGFYGKNNYGDDLMAECLSQRLSTSDSEVKVYSDVCKGDILNGMKDHSFLDSDWIVIGGGNIIGCHIKATLTTRYVQHLVSPGWLQAQRHHSL